MSHGYAAGVGDSASVMLENVLSAAPRGVLFLLILGVGWIAARALAAGVGGLLDRFGLDRAAERGGVRRWTGTYDPSELFAKLTLYAVLLFTLQTAFGVFGNNPVSDVITAVVGFLPQVFLALLIVVVVAAIAGAVRDLIRSALDGLVYGRALGTAAQVVVLSLGVIAALNQVDVATAVTTPVLIAILATVGGVVVVGAGGGLIQPMRRRWERVLDTVEQEAATAAAQVARNAERRREITAAQSMVTSRYPEAGLNDEYRTVDCRNNREYRTVGHPSTGSTGYGASSPEAPAHPTSPVARWTASQAAGMPTGDPVNHVAGDPGRLAGHTGAGPLRDPGNGHGHTDQQADQRADQRATERATEPAAEARAAEWVARDASVSATVEGTNRAADHTIEAIDHVVAGYTTGRIDGSGENAHRSYRIDDHSVGDFPGREQPIEIGDYHNRRLTGQYLSGRTRGNPRRRPAPVPVPPMSAGDRLHPVVGEAEAPARNGMTPGWDNATAQPDHESSPVEQAADRPVDQAEYLDQPEFADADELNRPPYWIEPVQQEAGSSIYRGQGYGQ